MEIWQSKKCTLKLLFHQIYILNIVTYCNFYVCNNFIYQIFRLPSFSMFFATESDK